MDDYDLTVARDVGEMKADIRTIKHDMNGLQQSIVLLSGKLNDFNTDKAKGLGFFAGASFIVTAFGAIIIGLIKLILLNPLSGSAHP